MDSQDLSESDNQVVGGGEIAVFQGIGVISVSEAGIVLQSSKLSTGASALASVDHPSSGIYNFAYNLLPLGSKPVAFVQTMDGAAFVSVSYGPLTDNPPLIQVALSQDQAGTTPVDGPFTVALYAVIAFDPYSNLVPPPA